MSAALSHLHFLTALGWPHTCTFAAAFQLERSYCGACIIDQPEGCNLSVSAPFELVTRMYSPSRICINRKVYILKVPAALPVKATQRVHVSFLCVYALYVSALPCLHAYTYVCTPAYPYTHADTGTARLLASPSHPPATTRHRHCIVATHTSAATATCSHFPSLRHSCTQRHAHRMADCVRLTKGRPYKDDRPKRGL